MARNYRKEYDNYQGKPDQIKKRSQRNKARRAMVKAGAAKKGDGKDVGHKTPIAKGGGNSRSNLKMQTKASNRSFARTRKAKMK